MGKTTIYEELKACTVRIVNKSIENQYSVKGTGFFIGKNKILTCHHVIDSDKLKVIWNNKEYEIKILEEKKDIDLILLEIDANNEKFVDIDSKVNVRDKCYAFGFPNNTEENDERADGLYSNKDGMTFEVVDENDGMIKFKGEQFKEGFSGSPVLNEESEKVCSIISISRDVDELKGGYGISLEKLSLFKDKIEINPPIKIPIIKDEIKIGIIKTVPIKMDDGRILNVSIYPVTIYEYNLFCKENKKFQTINSIYSSKENSEYPIVNISWEDTERYCKWLSKKINKEVRLLYWSEWNFIVENSIPKNNFEKNITHSSTELQKNNKIEKDMLGLCNIVGNIYEWCKDGNKNKKYIKGLAFNDKLESIDNLINYKKMLRKSTKNYNLGFRIVF